MLDGFEELCEGKQLPVSRVCEERVAGNGVLGVEEVGAGRVVDNDGLGQVSAHECQVLHVLALVHHTLLTKQAGANHAHSVQLIQQWVGVLWAAAGGQSEQCCLSHNNEPATCRLCVHWVLTLARLAVNTIIS